MTDQSHSFVNPSVQQMPKPPMKKGFFAKMNKQVLFAVAAVIVFAVGGAAAAFLSNQNQDTRQQAAACTGARNCSVTCNNGQSFSDACPGNGSFSSCDQWKNEACSGRGGWGGGGGTPTESTPPSSGGGSGCAEGTKKTRIQCGGCLDSKCIPTDDANAAGISKTCNTLIDQYCQVAGCGGEGVVPKAGEQCCSGFQRCPGSGRCGVTCLDSCIGEGSSLPKDGSCCDGTHEEGGKCVKDGSGTGGTTQKCASPNICKIASECYGSSGQIESNFSCDGGLVCCKNVACKLSGEVSDSDGACCSGKRDGNKCVSCLADGATTQSTGDCCSKNAKYVGSTFTCVATESQESTVCGSPGAGRCQTSSDNSYSCGSGWRRDTSCSKDVNLQNRCCTNDSGRSDHLNGETCTSNADCVSELNCNPSTKKCEPAQVVKCSSSSGDARCRGIQRDTACMANGAPVAGSVCRGYTSSTTAPCSCVDRYNNEVVTEVTIRTTLDGQCAKQSDGSDCQSGKSYTVIPSICPSKLMCGTVTSGAKTPIACGSYCSNPNGCTCTGACAGTAENFGYCCYLNGSTTNNSEQCCSKNSKSLYQGVYQCLDTPGLGGKCSNGGSCMTTAKSCENLGASNLTCGEGGKNVCCNPRPTSTKTKTCWNAKCGFNADVPESTACDNVVEYPLSKKPESCGSSTSQKTCWNSSCQSTTNLTTEGKCLASHPYVSRPTYCDSSTGQPSNCSAAGASCEATNCCTNGAVCQGVSGNRKCEIPPTKDVCPGENAVCGANYIAFKCGNLSNNQCLENPRDFTNWDEAVKYAGGCGQVDQVCTGGTNNRGLCGAFTIFNSTCGGGPGPSPSPSGPVCMNVVLSKQTVKVGDTVSLTCGNVTGATAYEFRIKTPAGQITTIAAQSSGSRNSQDFTISQKGTYKAQCRICTGSSCQEWETL